LNEQTDIVNYLQEKYQNRNWGFDIIRMTILHAMTEFNFVDSSCIHNVFSGIGTCELKQLSSIEDIEGLLNCYLVYYKPNYQGDSGPQANGSTNYLFHEFAAGILKGSEKMIHNVYPYIESLKEKGLTNDIDIIIAYDTFINKGLIVDGTKRSLALYYIKHTDKNLFRNLLASIKYSIKFVYLRSYVCRILFPIDFCKLC
jgi:hypothetical protein